MWAFLCPAFKPRYQSPRRDLGGPVIPRLGTILDFTIKPTAMWAFLCPAFKPRHQSPRRDLLGYEPSQRAYKPYSGSHLL